MRPAQLLPALCFATVTCLGLFAIAQQSASVSFHHFRPYKPGLYRQDAQAFSNGKPFGQPVSSTTCSGPVTPESAQAARTMANQYVRNCSSTVLTDTPTLAVSEQVCDPGILQTVIHTTMKSIDERTYELDTDMSKGGTPFMNSHVRVTYQGTCTPEKPDAAQMQMPKPSKEDCAQLPEMRQQLQDGTSGCASMPADYKPRCDAAMKIAQGHIQQFEAMCK